MVVLQKCNAENSKEHFREIFAFSQHKYSFRKQNLNMKNYYHVPIWTKIIQFGCTHHRAVSASASSTLQISKVIVKQRLLNYTVVPKQYFTVY